MMASKMIQKELRICRRILLPYAVHLKEHAWTLDPMAAGFLILCIDKATKVVDRFYCSGSHQFRCMLLRSALMLLSLLFSLHWKWIHTKLSCVRLLLIGDSRLAKSLNVARLFRYKIRIST